MPFSPVHHTTCRAPAVLRAAIAFAVLYLLGVATDATAGETTKVLVRRDDRAAQARVERRGGRLVAERGVYRVFALDASRAERIAGAVARPDFDRIALRRRDIDTRRSGVQARAQDATTAPRPLALVQFAAPPTDADLRALEDSGARIVQAVPQNAFLVWTGAQGGGAGLSERTAGGQGVQYVAEFTAEDALSPALDAAAASSAVVPVTVQLFRHEDIESDLARVTALAAQVLREPWDVLDGRYVNIRIDVRGVDLAALAAIDAVVNVEPYRAPELNGERQGQILAGQLNALGQSPTGPGYLAWLAGKGMSTNPADYPIVAIVDDGVDNGTTLSLATEFYRLGNPGLDSRLAFAVKPPGSFGLSLLGEDGHGTLNASIAGGYNTGVGALMEDASGYNFGLGIAPYGRLANVRLFSPDFDPGFGDASMVADYYTRGARISSNSWGSNAAGAYTTDSQEYDALTRDALPATPGNQPLLFVFAAGNRGPGAGSIGSPATAKNVLSVGASETADPAALAGDGCGETGSGGDDARDMAAFSSRGPCADGRMKPDIVAPGTFINGVASRPVFTGSGVCGAPANDFVAPGTDALFPAGSLYTWSSGTSHSTPAIAGYGALIGEFLARVYGIASPSPALQKAYVMHSGRHLGGAGANDDLPSPGQGFGIADMNLGLDTAAPRFLHDQATVLGAPGEGVTFYGTAADPARPLRVALVWTDAPGPSFGAAYVNDLDLRVAVGGAAYLGNHFAFGESQTGGVPDSRNNAELVARSAAGSGLVTIDVEATNLSGDGVPGNGDATDQDFALVAYNFSPTVHAGAVAVDRAVYTCADIVRITLVDTDLAGAGSVIVPVSSTTGDLENVALTAVPPGAGVFSATITTTATGSAGDGLLRVSNAATITVTYADANDGTGNPANAQASAAIDCAPPQVSNVAVEAVTSTTARVALDTNEATTVLVRYGATCAALTAEQASPVTSAAHAVDLSGLLQLTNYRFAVQATDVAGNTATDNNGGACYAFTTLEQGDYLTEQFNGLDFDLAYQALTFTPDGSSGGYSLCRGAAAHFPTDPTGGTALALTLDDFAPVTLGGGAQVVLHGQAYGSFYVGSHGYLTFESGDTTYIESFSNHFDQPRISALFRDIDPTLASVSWRQLADRVAVTWENVPETLEDNTSNSFQIELFFDGRIRITYLGIDASEGLVGLSRGGGVPADFIESHLRAYPPCAPGAACPSVPAVGCAAAPQSSLLIKAQGGTRDKLLWKWNKGPAISPLEFGDPTDTTHYALCLYAGPSPIGAAHLPASLAWKGNAKGFKFKDPFGVQSGIQTVILRGGDGAAKILVKGKGESLPDPLSGVLPLPVTAQLVNSDTGTCWQSSYTAATVLANDGEQFRAKAP